MNPPVETLPGADGGLGGRLAENIVHFARALRRAGVKVGPAQVRTAIEAVRVAGFTRRTDFYYTLRATLITRPEHLETYHQIFRMFWRDPGYLEKMMQMMLPLLETMQPAQEGPPEAAQRRASDALAAEKEQAANPPERDLLEMDARLSWSTNEVLRGMDFEQMTADELKQAEAAVRSLILDAAPLKTRRFSPARKGSQADVRAMMRRSVRRGGEFDRMILKAPRTRPPALVAICDISGSMSVYARMMMHFLHALTWSDNSGWGKVHGFTFGTRLTNVTRALRMKDIDDALDAVGHDAPDWQGGTRIGEALRQFNRQWSRRVLGQGAVVLLITDGLERGDLSLLEKEAERLSLSCRRLIWLNPLLRWEEFAPRAGGIRALMPLVDSFHACHSLDSLADLAGALSGSGDKARMMQRMREMDR